MMFFCSEFVQRQGRDVTVGYVVRLSEEEKRLGLLLIVIKCD